MDWTKSHTLPVSSVEMPHGTRRSAARCVTCRLAGHTPSALEGLPLDWAKVAESTETAPALVWRGAADSRLSLCPLPLTSQKGTRHSVHSVLSSAPPQLRQARAATGNAHSKGGREERRSQPFLHGRLSFTADQKRL